MGRPSADYKYGDINIIISRCTLNVLFTYTNSKFFSWFNIIALNVLKSPSKMYKQVQSLRLCQNKKWWISSKYGEVGKNTVDPTKISAISQQNHVHCQNIDQILRSLYLHSDIKPTSREYSITLVMVANCYKLWNSTMFLECWAPKITLITEKEWSCKAIWMGLPTWRLYCSHLFHLVENLVMWQYSNRVQFRIQTFQSCLPSMKSWNCDSQIQTRLSHIYHNHSHTPSMERSQGIAQQKSPSLIFCDIKRSSGIELLLSLLRFPFTRTSRSHIEKKI